MHMIAPTGSDFSSNDVQIHGFEGYASRFLRITIHPFLAFRIVRRLRPVIVHMHDPELLPVALLLQLLGYKVIFDSHEDYPQNILEKSWLPSFLRKPLSICVSVIDRIAGTFLSGIVAATPTIALAFGGERAVILRNYPLLQEFAPIDSTPLSKRSPVFTYIGNISLARGVSVMIEAVRLLRERSPEVVLKLAGKFSSPELQTLVESSPGSEAIEYHEWLDRDAVGRLLGAVSGGLLLFAPTPTHIVALPNKLFEYMAAGLPVIASNFPFWREVLGDSDCVLFVDPTNAREVADAMEWLIDHPEEAESMGCRGRADVLSVFNWSIEEQRLFELYDRILAT